jgi:uncharacterized damage-inducible protein DinB
MTRTAIDVWTLRLEAAYRADPFHALRKNIESVRLVEWDVRPASWSAEEFGTQPELSVCDLVFHVGGAKYMYADRAFGEMTLEWTGITPPASRDMQEVLAWLEAGHQLLVEGMAALTDDAQLREARLAPWRLSLTREQLLGIVINHDLYHSGEINRQRALMRGAEGWDRGG